ncbi:MAG TPA: SRPBCC domain-containing protein, partial [Magnetospirillaceae bacterium]|nr:SRPBCC domain-containing protein [Magnetospirillaceae bacterium]
MRDKSDLGTFVRQGSNSALRYERRYDRPVETVWKALTEPERLADWMGQARVDPYVGGRYELFINSPDPMRGRVVTWNPPELLEFSWTSPEAPQSVVRCELVREGAGTRLIFMHRAMRFAASCLTLGVFRMNYLKQQKNPFRQAANFWLVLLLHLAFGYLLVTGLGRSVVERLREPMDATVIIEPKLDQPLPMPPPKILPPPRDLILPPDILVDVPRTNAPTVFTDKKPDQPAAPPPEQVAAHVPVKVAPVVDPKHACALPEYPSRAIRAGWEGLVELEFLVGLD